MSSEFVSSLSGSVTSLTNGLESLITGNLVALFGVFALIIGLGLVIKLVTKSELVGAVEDAKTDERCHLGPL